MAEVTRVPLQPVSKGSILMLLLGIVIGALIAGGVAWWIARPASVEVEVVRAGSGATPQETDIVFVHYVGKLDDGTEFDRSQPTPWPIQGVMPEGTPMQLDGVIAGFREALLQMQKGGKYTVTIPAEKAYGANPPPGSPIPANADLTFEIEMVDFMPMAEAERRVQTLQQMMQAQQGETAPDGSAAGAEAASEPAPAE